MSSSSFRRSSTQRTGSSSDSSEVDESLRRDSSSVFREMIAGDVVQEGSDHIMGHPPPAKAAGPASDPVEEEGTMVGDAEVTRAPPQLDLVTIQRHVMAAAQSNLQTRKLLNDGVAILGTYHAQLGLDELLLREQRESVRKELEQLRDTESRMKARISFLFDACQHLEEDNASISSRFPEKVAQINEVVRLLGIEEEKLREATQSLEVAQGEIMSTSRELVTWKHALRDAKHTRLAKRHEEWEAVDEVDRLEEAMQLVQDEVDHLERRIRAAKVAEAQREHHNRHSHPAAAPMHSGVTPPSTVLRGLSGLSESQHGKQKLPSEGGGAGSCGEKGIGPSRRPTPAAAISFQQRSITCGPNGCMRPDCIAVAARVAELRHLLGVV